MVRIGNIHYNLLKERWGDEHLHAYITATVRILILSSYNFWVLHFFC